MIKFAAVVWVIWHLINTEGRPSSCWKNHAEHLKVDLYCIVVKIHCHQDRISPAVSRRAAKNKRWVRERPEECRGISFIHVLFYCVMPWCHWVLVWLNVSHIHAIEQPGDCWWKQTTSQEESFVSSTTVRGSKGVWSLGERPMVWSSYVLLFVPVGGI